MAHKADIGIRLDAAGVFAAMQLAGSRGDMDGFKAALGQAYGPIAKRVYTSTIEQYNEYILKQAEALMDARAWFNSVYSGGTFGSGLGGYRGWPATRRQGCVGCPQPCRTRTRSSTHNESHDTCNRTIISITSFHGSFHVSLLCLFSYGFWPSSKMRKLCLLYRKAKEMVGLLMVKTQKI